MKHPSSFFEDASWITVKECQLCGQELKIIGTPPPPLPQNHKACEEKFMMERAGEAQENK